MMKIAEKIMMIRKANGVTQAELAEVTLSSPSRISLIERGESEYTPGELKAIMQHFDIVDMPLTPMDCLAFKKRLYMWRDFIRDRRLEKALQWKEEIKSIVNLEPCDSDLPNLYRLFEALIPMFEGDLETAEQKLDELGRILNMDNIEHNYYYYYNRGLLHSFKSDYVESLNYHKKAYALIEGNKDFTPDDEGGLYYNIASCYSNLELPYHAILTILEMPKDYTQKRPERLNFFLNNALGGNYVNIGRYEKALGILEANLLLAKSLNNKHFVGITLFNLGILYKRTEKWDMAMDYFDEAMETFDEPNEGHMWACYNKIHCVIGMKKFPEAGKMIETAAKRYADDKMAAVVFDSLLHYLSISRRMKSHYDYNKESAEFIEQTAIPFFEGIHANFEVLEYCTLLEQYYKDKTNRKFLAASKLKSDIYSKMLFFGDM